VTLSIRVLTGILDRSVEVTFSTANGTATSNDDFISRQATLQFDASNLSRNVTVSIIDDNLLEGTEFFSANLATLVRGVSLRPGEATVNIIDFGDGESILTCPLFA